MQTQIGIIGAGPAGLMLSKFLHNLGLDNVVLESKSRDYVENRLRAGLLEQNTVNLLKQLGVSRNLEKNGIPHDGVLLSFNGERIHIPFKELIGERRITIYGQRFIVRDLIENLVDKEKKTIHFEAKATKVEGIETNTPMITYLKNGKENQLRCEFVVACDGYHGIGRQTLPQETYKAYSTEYPFSWLGILAETPPSSEELIYAFHNRGFALLSYRSPEISRLYLQVSNEDNVKNWSDEKIWKELQLRLGTKGWKLNEGQIIQKSITPMRSYVIDNLQYGTFFMAGDAAHIVPPTGGKGLNLALADVKILGKAFAKFYKNGNRSFLKSYSKDALRRIWRVQHFSNFMTQLLHKKHEEGDFGYQMQKAQFDYIAHSKAMRSTIAENYVGLENI